MERVVGVHVVVHGRVQGVGFRAFAVYEATQKGLQGWVRNRQDETVEVDAEGPKSVLEDFLQVLEKGPRLAHVTKITVDWKDANRQSKGFTIQRH